MSQYINEELRRLVMGRADFICEYCLISADDVFHRNQVDHIISLKHGGPTEAVNLASACFLCNLSKGADLGSVYWPTGQLTRFYNPRTDRWAEHFQLDGAVIRPLTEIGEVTARILGFNAEDRLLERQVLIANGKYPSAAAMVTMCK